MSFLNLKTLGVSNECLDTPIQPEAEEVAGWERTRAIAIAQEKKKNQQNITFNPS